MANPVGSVEAVFKASETAESRTPEVLAPVLEALKDLKEGGIDSSLVEAAKICADASREGMRLLCIVFGEVIIGVLLGAI